MLVYKQRPPFRYFAKTKEKHLSGEYCNQSTFIRVGVNTRGKSNQQSSKNVFPEETNAGATFYDYDFEEIKAPFCAISSFSVRTSFTDNKTDCCYDYYSTAVVRIPELRARSSAL